MAWGDNDPVAGWGVNDPTPEQARTKKPQGYDKARARIARNEATARKVNERFGGGMNALEDFTNQIARNTGASDEVGGAMNFLAQGAENVVRRVAGKPVEIPASTAYRAAADREREAQAEYARANPGKNALATGLGIVATGRPTGAVPQMSALQAGKYAAIQAAPFAFARQEGNALERVPGTVRDTALAFGVGSAFQAGANALGRSAQAAQAVRSPARRLSDEGVQLTPGQMAGGIGKRLEDIATSAPMTGAAINARRAEGIQDFNVAAYNRALAPISESVQAGSGAGRDAVADVGQRISGAYGRALDNVQVIPDQQFQSEVGQIVNNATLPPQVQQELDGIVNNTILGRFSGQVDGQTWKSIDEELGAMIRAADTGSTSQPTQRYLAEALRGVKRALGGALERANPQAAAAVKQADEAFANFARIRQGAQQIGADEGVMTPAQMLRATRAMDSSAGNRQFAQGDALMQDLAETGKTVLPNKVPDSGTALRVATGAGIFGGISGAASPVAALSAAAVDLAGAALYSRPVINVLNAIYRAKDPGVARSALAQLQSLAARNPALTGVYDELAQQLAAQPQLASGQPMPQQGQQLPTTP